MKSLNEIKKELEEFDIKYIDNIINTYKDDKRIGVCKLIESYKKKKEKYLKECERIQQMKKFEVKYGNEYKLICGIDEVGRGPLAGPVVACGVILPINEDILYLNDSKQLSVKKREELYYEIKQKAVSIGIGIIDNNVIDEINILQATYRAMKMSIDNMNIQPDLLLVDAVHIPDIKIKQVGIVKGDTLSISIAAASIVAKVTRDNMMNDYDKIYPEYNFASNKGYGSKEHIEAIKKYGLCPIHRKTFCKNFNM